jgi:hypothetical protein
MNDKFLNIRSEMKIKVWAVAFVWLFYGSSVSAYDLVAGLQLTKFDYEENALDGTTLNTERSALKDIGGLELQGFPEGNGVYFNTSYRVGDTEYIGGSTLNPTYGSVYSTTENRLFLQSIGYMTEIGTDKVRIPFYVGGGYRYWHRNIGNSGAVSGLDERYSWFFLELGSSVEFIHSGASTLGIDMKFRYGINPEMTVKGINGTFELSNVYGVSAALPWEVSLSELWSLHMRVGFDFWNIGRSNVIDGFLEPDSETWNSTFTVGLRYRLN